MKIDPISFVGKSVLKNESSSYAYYNKMNQNNKQFTLPLYSDLELFGGSLPDDYNHSVLDNQDFQGLSFNLKPNDWAKTLMPWSQPTEPFSPPETKEPKVTQKTPSSQELGKPSFRGATRPELNIQVETKNEQIYSDARNGDSKETKSLHKNVQALLGNYLDRQIKHKHLTEEQTQSVHSFQERQGSFDNFLELLGFSVQADGSLAEQAGHQEIQTSCLDYVQSTQFMRETLLSKSNFQQKLTRIKYAKSVESIIMEAPSITQWKQ